MSDKEVKLNLLQSLQFLLTAFLHGIYDACAWQHVFFTLYLSRSSRKALLKCFVLNGVVIVGLTIIISNFVIPFLEHGLRLATERLPDAVALKAIFLHDRTENIFRILVQLVYSVFWLYPIYALSFVLNAIWYRDIAKKTLEIAAKTGHQSKSVYSKLNYKRVAKQIAAEVYKAFVCMSFLFIFTLLGHVLPYRIGSVVHAASLSWLNSLYCFDYIWSASSRTLEETFGQFESRWVYFLGFGLPGTMLTYWWPYIISSGLYSLLFPFYIITACFAKPIPSLQEQPPQLTLIPSSVPLFSLSRRLSRKLFKMLISKH